MSTFINMALAQVVKRNGVPFEVVNPTPSKELLEAIQEGEQILEDIKNDKRKAKKYHSVKELIEDLENGE